MKGYRKVQENKAYRLYVVGTKFSKKFTFTKEKTLFGNYDMTVYRYHFTDKENPNNEEKGDCIYVEKRFIIRRKNKMLKSTMIIRNTEWDSTSVAMIWSRWH